jgi:hypothetical protein
MPAAVFAPLHVADPEASERAGTRHWVAVASAEHVRRGRREGFMQVCHGKGGPLRRIRPGDRVAYYSPTVHFGGKDRLQAFTALGTVLQGDPYQADMGDGFHPFRRDVCWDTTACDAAIVPLLEQLSFTTGRTGWGYAFRFGLVPVTAQDMALIAQAMHPHTTIRHRHTAIT